MGFLRTLLIYVLTTFLAEALRPRSNSDSKPAGIGDFQMPTASEDRPVPVVFGTALVEGPNVLWYGDLRTSEIIKKISTGFFGDTTHTRIGWRYHLGLDLALCHGPIDAILEVRYGDRAAWSGTFAHAFEDYTPADLVISAPTLYGGDAEGKEGGVAGTFKVYWGSDPQSPDSYLESKIGSGAVPGYIDTCHLVWKGGYIGNAPSLKSFSFVVRRLPNSFYWGYHDIDGDANPAHVIVELLLNESWGAGVPWEHLDTDSFYAAIQTLHGEGFGMSFVWDRRTSCEDMISEVLRTIDGVLYSDITTGKIGIALTRAGATPALTLDESNIISLASFSRTSQDEATNELRVVYTDSSHGHIERALAAQDIAGREAIGEIVSSTVSYPGIRNQELASKVAVRDLRALAAPLAKAKLTARLPLGHTLHPGAAVSLSWARLGIEDMAMRVTRARYGTVEDGKVELDLVEDQYSLGTAIYTVPEPYSYTPPAEAAPQPTTGGIVLCPPALHQHLDAYSEHAIIYAFRPDSSHTGWRAVSVDTGYPQLGEACTGWAVMGSLTADYPEYTHWIDASGQLVVALDNPNDIDLVPSGAAAFGILGDTNVGYFSGGVEYIRWSGVIDNGNGTVTLQNVVRAALGGVPATHEVVKGAKLIMLAPGSFAVAKHPWTAAGAPSYVRKLLTQTAAGELDANTAPVESTPLVKPSEAPQVGDLHAVGCVQVIEPGIGNVPPTIVTGPWLEINGAHAGLFADLPSLETWQPGFSWSPRRPASGDFGEYLVANRPANSGAQYILEVRIEGTGVIETLLYAGVVEGTVRSIDIRNTEWYQLNQPYFYLQPDEYHMVIKVTEYVSGQASAQMRSVVRWVRPAV